nr:T9SS type A sorting domain-containing protein [Saprospiraceae bacterium]
MNFPKSLTSEGNLMVFNTMGQQLYKQTISKGTQQLPIDLSHLPAGQYIVKVRTESEVWSQSVVVMR